MRNMAVIGGGTMGLGVAYVFAAAGCKVVLVEPDTAQAVRAMDMIGTRAQLAARRGRLELAVATTLPSRVSTVPVVRELPLGLDLIVEAVPERLELKRGVLAEAQDRKPALLASNTSALSIDGLAKELDRPESFLGMHFFNPVWAMPLLELVRGSATSDDALATAKAAAELIGKQTIVVRDTPGFATSRLGVAIGLEAIRMLEEGVASASDIDQAMELGYRHSMGPLRLTDLVGLDVRLDIARHLEGTYGPRFAPPQLLVDKVAAGNLGKKTGQGFYAWPEGER